MPTFQPETSGDVFQQAERRDARMFGNSPKSNTELSFFSGAPTDNERIMEAKLAEAEASAQELRRYQAGQSIVSSLFQGEGASDPSSYSKAAGLAAPISVKLAMELAHTGQQMRAAQTTEALHSFKAAQEEHQSQLGILSSAGPSTYRQAMHQYTEAGGKLPSWYSGSWDQDKPYVEQLAKSSMTALQQAELVGHQANLAARQQALEETAKQHEIQAAKWKDELALKDRRQQALEEYRHESGIRKDRQFAAQQQGRQASKELSGIRQAEPMVEELLRRREDFGSIDPSSVPAIVKKATARAVQQQFEPGEDRSLDEIAQDTIGSVVDELTPGKSKMFGLMPGKKTLTTEGSGASGKIKPSPAASAGNAPKAGEIQQGYRFKGGNPADPKSWEKV